MTEAIDFKFGMQLVFAKTHNEITPKGKVRVALGSASSSKFRGCAIFLQRLVLGTSNLVHNFGLPKPTIKPHPEEKWA